jgi:hypothetical protein
MATRYYPAVKVPGARIHGTTAGAWARQSFFSQSWSPVQWTWQLSTSKTNAGALTTRSAKTNQQGDYDFFGWRMITPPLMAQTIDGTVDLCWNVRARWNDGFTTTNDSVVRYKLHIYITVGQTAAVRHTLLDNYVDSVNWPGVSGAVWRSLFAAQALIAGDTQAGDCIMVELGARVVSSPTPVATYPPTTWTDMPIRGTGTNDGAGAPFVDAVAGNTATNLAPWIEFSDTIVEQAAPSPPANDACVDAIVIAALPYTSPEIDTTQSADTDRAGWWTWTAPVTGKVCFHTFGSNYGTIIALFTGGCGGLTPVGFVSTNTELAQHRAQSSVMFTAQIGVQYWIRVRNSNSVNNAPQSGGLLQLSGFTRQTTPATDDIYLPAGTLVQIRSGSVINLNAGFSSVFPTGVAIDYTERPMDDLNGGTHVGERILVGLHNFDLVEIFDLPTLSYGDFQFEVDFIGDPLDVPGVSIHPAQLYITAAGRLYTGWFGNGYLFVAGLGGLPAILSTLSNDPTYAAVKSLEATDGDSQAGAPFTATYQLPSPEITSPWAIGVDEAAGVLYYTSGGFYEPVGGAIVRRYDVNASAQLPDLVTLALQGVNNPGLKGLQVIPGGGLLICNGTVVHRLDTVGGITTTYTPSIAEDSQSLVDVRMTADGQGFWVIDLATTRLFHFLLDGTEVETVQPYLVPGTLVQMALYQPEGITPPEPPEPPDEGCPLPLPPDSGGGTACSALMALPSDSGGGGAEAGY